MSVVTSLGRDAGRRRARGCVFLAAAVLAAVVPLRAHDTKISGHLRVTLGWADEPAFVNARNAVVVALADNAGPLKEPAASLSVEVSFGAERITLPLEPFPGKAGELRAWIVPTRAGTYTFHVTGKVSTHAVDVTSTCSATTFHCVEEAASIQFPVKEPPAGQLAEAVGRALPRADLAAARAGRADTLSIAAIGASSLALVLSIAAWVQRRRPRE